MGILWPFRLIAVSSIILLALNLRNSVAGPAGKNDMVEAQSASSQMMEMGGDMMSCASMMPFGTMMIGKAGEWMVGYQFMFDDMDGSLVGTDDISISQILKRFPAAPTDMTMKMHMVMAMYSPTDKLTLAAMIPFVRKEMNNVNADGSTFVMHTDGIGDVELRAAYAVVQSPDRRHQLLLNGGIGIPTGAIDATMDGMQLEYCMQVGSGTVSLLPGLTYLGEAMPWGWGADFNPIVRVGRNDRGWRLGNRYEARIWGARQLTSWLTLWAGMSGVYWATSMAQTRTSTQPSNKQLTRICKAEGSQQFVRTNVSPPVQVSEASRIFCGSESSAC